MSHETNTAITIDHQLTWVWRKFVEDEWDVTDPPGCDPSVPPCGGKQPFYRLDLDSYFGEQLVHELAHKFRVNEERDDEGHCDQDAWSDFTKWCRMNVGKYDSVHNADQADGIVDFHFIQRVDQQGRRFDSEYLTIRDAENPLR